MNTSLKNSSASFFDKLKKKQKPVLTIWHKLLFLSPILIIICIIKGNQWYVDYQLSNNGTETIAIITMISSVGIRDPVEIDNVSFEFTVNDSIYTGYTIAETNNNYALTPNGLPLSIGDKYYVRYVIDNPEIYVLNYNKPDLETVLNYIHIASGILERQLTFPVNNNHQCFCLSVNIFRKFGFSGLADLLFYDESMVENFSHNSSSFKKLMESKEVKELIKKCKE